MRSSMAVAAAAVMVLAGGSVEAQTLASREALGSTATRGVTAEEIGTVARAPADMPWWRLAELPGAEISYLIPDASGRHPYTFRLKFPDGYELAPHTHGARRFITVLQGTYHVGFGRTADRSMAVAFPAGSFIMLPRNTPHFAWTEGETVLQVSGKGPFAVHWANGRQPFASK